MKWKSKQTDIKSVMKPYKQVAGADDENPCCSLRMLIFILKATRSYHNFKQRSRVVIHKIESSDIRIPESQFPKK